MYFSIQYPVEIRNLIYVYASGARHEVRYQDLWRVKPLKYHKMMIGLETAYPGLGADAARVSAEYDREQDLICYHDTRDRADATCYQLGNHGIVVIYGHRPPTKLNLFRKQLYSEVKELFLSNNGL